MFAARFGVFVALVARVTFDGLCVVLFAHSAFVEADLAAIFAQDQNHFVARIEAVRAIVVADDAIPDY